TTPTPWATASSPSGSTPHWLRGRNSWGVTVAAVGRLLIHLDRRFAERRRDGVVTLPLLLEGLDGGAAYLGAGQVHLAQEAEVFQFLEAGVRDRGVAQIDFQAKGAKPQLVAQRHEVVVEVGFADV